MRFTYFVIFVLALFSCKKDQTTPPPEPVANYQLHHSGSLDGIPYALDTNGMQSTLVDGYNLDDFLYRYVNMRVWLQGDNLEVDSVATPAYAFNLEVVVQYGYMELNNNGEMPALTAQKLANAINNGAYSWNDGSDMKEMSVAVHNGDYWNALVGGTQFVIVNPHVQATAIGNGAINLVGGVDSLMFELGPQAKFLTNHNFDYTIQVPQ